MKMYKGFNRDMTCRGFKFVEGETYEVDEAKLCESGFHACEDPIDCLGYYPPGTSIYREVDLDATDEVGDDSKRVGRRIKIGAALDIAGICKAHFEYIKEHCIGDKTGGNESALSGGNESALSGGDKSALSGGDKSALSGGYGSALSGGDKSALSGGNESALSGGNESALSGGDESALSGGDKSALSGGYESALSGGNESALSGGNWSALSGGDRSVMRGGENSRFRGGIWSVFACVVQDEGRIVGMKTAVVDGKKIKPDTWYKLKDGEFVEVSGDA